MEKLKIICGFKRSCHPHRAQCNLHGNGGNNPNPTLCRNITNRRRAQEALRESEEKHRILLSESPDPTFSFTSEGRYRYVNKAFALGVGKPVEDIIDKTMWDVFSKEEADKRFASLCQVFRTGEEKVIEVRVPRAGGDRYYMTTITPIKDTAEGVLSAICSSKEITERKRMEAQLLESEERYRALFRIFRHSRDHH